MTKATAHLLARLRAHIGDDTARRNSLLAHCSKAMGRPLHNGTLSYYLAGKKQPGADAVIPILRWMQLQGVITPADKATGLFTYAAQAEKKPVPAKKSRKKK